MSDDLVEDLLGKLEKAEAERDALVACIKDLQAEVEDAPGLSECMGKDMCDRLKRILEEPQG